MNYNFQFSLQSLFKMNDKENHKSIQYLWDLRQQRSKGLNKTDKLKVTKKSN